MEVIANRVDPRQDGWIVDWRYGEACPVCGQSCKRATVEQLASGGELLYIGDGYSDRCAGESADRVFATGELAAHFESKGSLRALPRLLRHRLRARPYPKLSLARDPVISATTALNAAVVGGLRIPCLVI